MIDLSEIAPNDLVSLNGWQAYWMLGTAAAHVSVYTKSLVTEQWRVIRNNQVKRGQKTRVADVPPPHLMFDEFHVTLNGLHHYYSVTGIILPRDGETNARPDSATWRKANAMAAKFLTRVGVPTAVESLTAQLTGFTGPAPAPPQQAQPVQAQSTQLDQSVPPVQLDPPVPPTDSAGEKLEAPSESTPLDDLRQRLTQLVGEREEPSAEKPAKKLRLALDVAAKGPTIS
jgi:hypothetical protein